MAPKPAFSPAAVLRKAGPYALFLLLGVAMLYGPALLHWLLDLVHGAPTTAHAGNATPAEIVADQQAAGWPAPGLVTGKLVIAASAYVFFIILRWLMQQLTHPAPTAWAKKGYSTEFDSLPGRDKFTVYAGLRLNSVLLAAAALLFAALVQ